MYIHSQLGALAAACLLIATATAYASDEPHPSIRVAAAVNNLSHIRSGGSQDTRIFLFRTTSGGIQQKVWSGSSNATGSWSGWTTRQEAIVDDEGPLDTSLVGAGGEYFSNSFGIWLPRFHAIYDFADPSGGERVARPYWNWLPTAYTFDHDQPPSTNFGDGMVPFSGFTWRLSNNQRLNIFGMATSFNGSQLWSVSLREMWFDGATWRFTDHGRPPGSIYFRLGPQSTVWTNPNGNGTGYVFVSTDNEELQYRYWGSGCGGWCWQNLGRPSRTTDMRTPVAMTYWGGRVNVFVSARTDDGYHLYSRHFDGSEWQDWQDWGQPPNRPLNTPQDAGFDMNTAMVWYTADGTLRINMFGHRDRVARSTSGLSTHIGGDLVEFVWDGARWTWGRPLQFPETEWFEVEGEWREMPLWFLPMNAATVDTRSWERLSLFGEDEWGRTWEYYWDGRWNWRQH